MPSVAQETPAVSSCKKRRRDDSDDHGSYSHGAAPQALLHADGPTKTTISIPNFPTTNVISHSQTNSHLNTAFGVLLSEKAFDHGALFHQHHPSPPVRRMMPLSATKKQRLSSDEDRPSPQRQLPPPQQQQIKLLQERSANSRSTTPSHTATTNTATASANLMTRCHICFRKPAKKLDLDSFADCQGCSQRTCYVCIRECLGWGPHLMVEQQPGGMLPDTGLGEQGTTGTLADLLRGSDTSFTMLDADDALETGPSGVSRQHTNHQARNHKSQGSDGWEGGCHRQMVCSRCCVERGPDGDVVCLGCLPFVEG